MKIIRYVWRAARLYLLGVTVFVLSQIVRNPRRTLERQPNRGFPGKWLETITETEHYRIVHLVEDGIERVSYIPHEKQHNTPIMMQHGMWHGAWCWSRWQHLLAQQGWESHAYSLPGHALSPVQRPIVRCTLDYYLTFLKREVDRLEQKPVLMGHSMGGALAQWYLKYVTDDLPAVVLVAPWVSHNVLADGVTHIGLMDVPGVHVLPWVTFSATPWVRNPQRAAEKLISPEADITPEALYAQLSPESLLVTFQHNAPFWSPPEDVRAPMLLVAGEADAVCSVAGERATAAHYGAEFVLIEGAGHNLMMDRGYIQTAATIDNWLSRQDID